MMNVPTLLAMLVMRQVSSTEIPVVWSGAFSDVHSPEIMLVGDQKALYRTWERHTRHSLFHRGNTKLVDPPIDNMPTVNFETHVVLVIFGGTGRPSGYTLRETLRDGKVLTVRYLPLFPYGYGDVHLDGGHSYTPYLFALLPKSFEVLRVERGILEPPYKNHSPQIKGYERLKELTLK